jgi:hypothetical protein
METVKNKHIRIRQTFAHYFPITTQTQYNAASQSPLNGAGKITTIISPTPVL